MNKLNSKIYFFILFFLLTQCQSTKTTISKREKSSWKIPHERKQFREVYINQFKLTYFRKLLVTSFNHSDAIKSLIESDHSGFTEPILSENDLNLINSLVNSDNRRMIADSSSRIGRVAEGAEGKRALGYILNKLENKWLDSLARNRYKQSERKVF